MSYTDVYIPNFFLPYTDVSSLAFKKHRFMFGKTQEMQMRRLSSEMNAYYGFIKPSSIRSAAFMSAEYEMNTIIPSDTWLQTITLS